MAFDSKTKTRTDKQTMVRGLGIEFSSYNANGHPEAEKQTGSAKIISVAYLR